MSFLSPKLELLYQECSYVFVLLHSSHLLPTTHTHAHTILHYLCFYASALKIAVARGNMFSDVLLSIFPIFVNAIQSVPQVIGHLRNFRNFAPTHNLTINKFEKKQ